LQVTFRRDRSGRPRINKPESYLDREQKANGEYYYYTDRELGESTDARS
jgi:ATP-binding cassette, sub-family E, member 1